jgi:hypothetical protein
MKRVSGVLVVLLSILLADCGGKPAPAPTESQPLSAPASGGVSNEERAFLALLPASGAAADWNRAKEPRRYSQGDLWEYIDGAAETYLAYNFQELAAAGYVHAPTRVDATAEIYRMADALSAFGIYGQERNASCEEVRLGVDGCYAGGALSFWSGSYYVKMSTSQESAGVKQALLALGGKISEGLGAQGSAPAQVGMFPTRNLVPHSVKYVARDVLGQSFFANAFEAQYRQGASSSKLTVIAFDSAEAAAAGLVRYRAFVGTGGKVTNALTAPGEGGFAGVDSYDGTIVAIRSGKIVLVGLGVSSDQTGLALIRECLAKWR